MANIIKPKREKMKKIFNVLALFFIGIGFANAATVVGTVNGNPITDSDITARTELMAKQGNISTTNRKQAFQNIIDDYVKLDYAAKFNVKPTDADADAELKRMNLGDISPVATSVARLAMRANIAWQVIIARTILPTVEINDSDIADEKKFVAREHGLPIEMTFIRLTDVPMEISEKLTKPKDCAAAEKMVEDLGGYPQKITAMHYELAPEIREKLTNLPALTWSKNDNGSVVLICSQKQGKEYKELDKMIRQNVEFKKAESVADQQLKQLRRKAVIIINDDRYKL